MRIKTSLWLVAVALLVSPAAQAHEGDQRDRPVKTWAASTAKAKTSAREAGSRASRNAFAFVSPDRTPRQVQRRARARHEAACTGRRWVAAWYRSGKRTANGERFNSHGLTAAHRSLAFGTRLKVTNPRTGRSVAVRINDRGPFVRGVSLDLAMGAARAIGMTGTQPVCIG